MNLAPLRLSEKWFLAKPPRTQRKELKEKNEKVKKLY